MLVWDEAKRAANIARHGVDFAAAERFAWASAVIDLDDREDYGEDRLIAYGFIGLDIYVLVHVEVGDDIRVISLRTATAREERYYGANVGR